MARTPQDVTETELAVLQVLWEQDSATVRQITDALYANAKSSQHATVQKLLERLEAKKCVRRNRKSWPHVFAATINRDVLIERRLRTTAEQLCDGSLQPLLTHLVRAKRLSADERRSLRGLLDQLERESKGKKKS